MVSYQLAPEQQELRESVARFAREVVAPVIGGYYERGEFPYDIVARMGKLGLFGLPFPAEYGGMGGDYFALCLALEELARVDSSVAITLEAGVSLGAMPIYRFGTEEQRRRWLPELCTGERLAAFGLTEPGGGSDIPGGMRTTATLQDAQWVVDGSKAFITNAGTSITSLVTVLAITGRNERGGKEISSVIIPNGTPGFVPGPQYSKVGWCASDTRELSFAGCRVPAENLLGERGRGYAQFLQILDEGRVAIAALATGLAQGCVDECVAYAGQREAFGRRLAEHQAIAVHHRRHGGTRARGPAGLVRRSRPADGRPADQEGVRDRQADRLQRGDGQRARRHPGVRRLRVHELRTGRPLLPRREGPGDRRGHVRGPAHAHRPAAKLGTSPGG